MLLEEGWQMYMYVIGTVTSGESSIKHTKTNKEELKWTA